MPKNREVVEMVSIIKNNLKRVASNSINQCDQTIFSDFYIDRGFESNFHQTVVNNDYVLLMGRAGSGKSTLIKKVILESDLFCKNKSLGIEFLNFEIHYSSKDSEIFRKVIEDLYEKIIFKYLKDYQEKINFAKKILYESNEKNTKYYIGDARQLLNEFDILTRGKISNIDDIITNIVRDDSVIVDEFNKFLKNLTSVNSASRYLSSLLYYLYNKFDRKFLFIFDNVDSLAYNQQTAIYDDFVHFAQNINNGEVIAKLIIAIRDENLYCTGNAGGNTHIEPYYISQLSSQDDKFLTNENLIFDALSKKIKMLLSKRYIEVDNIPIASDYKSVVIIQKILDYFMGDKFIIGNMFKYSNLSIRHAMYNTLDFISWLLEDDRHTHITLIKTPYIMLNSLYIGWISSEKIQAQNIRGLNLVNVMDTMEKSKYRVVGCDISILILNFIANKTKDIGISSVTFSDIVKGFEHLSDERLLRSAIYNLFMLNKEIRIVEKYGHIISLPSSSKVESPNDILDSTIISLFPRAEELLFLSQTFTFNNILYYKLLKGDKNYINNYFLLNNYFDKLPDYLKNQQDFLKRLMKVHLIELYRIYKKEKDISRGHDKWFEDYLLVFGHRNKFQVTNIISLGNSYLRNLLALKSLSPAIKIEIEKYIEDVSNLLSQYMDEIKMIKTNSDSEKYFLSLFGQKEDIQSLVVIND